MNFLDMSFPDNFEYSSDGEFLPIEFYLEILPRSKVIHLKLGYFSSKAIQVLAYGFAQFLHNDGVIKIISNHFVYDEDKELVSGEIRSPDVPIEGITQDVSWLYAQLSSESQHFVDCLKLLVKSERLELIPVKLKPERMVHFKQGVFIDEIGNKVVIEGSCNFTANGLLENAESISVYRSWGGEYEKVKVAHKAIDISEIIERKSRKYLYLDQSALVSAVNSVGRDRSLNELMDEELDLISRESQRRVKAVLDRHRLALERRIEQIKIAPKFPYRNGPRRYQNDAYLAWCNNSHRGIFAMATGTGKTITALNCVLNEYKKNGNYQAIILVPSKPLLEQWYDEARGFNFTNVFLASSDHPWDESLNNLDTIFRYSRSESFIIITTYLTFSSEKFQRKLVNLPENTVVIADEVHNIGSESLRLILPNLKFTKRIGLSATPERQFDSNGNLEIQKFFDSRSPYTYSFTMERAISEGILCSYYYYPHLVSLTESEMEGYVEISQKLARMFDHKTRAFRDAEAAKFLLLERKRIIHKAVNKLKEFESILRTRIAEGKTLGYSFVYVPEGSDDASKSFLQQYMEVCAKVAPGVRSFHYTSKTDNRGEILRDFENGYVDSLYSMKCLDEGVDIPRAELAIFCASTGNPRQFIQRRGRILRRHPDKEYAVIHDLVVVPADVPASETIDVERKLVRDELSRVVNFAVLSLNYYDAMDGVSVLCEKYGLNIYALQAELEEYVDEG